MMITLVWLGAFAMVVLTVYFIMKFRSVTPDTYFVKEKRDSLDWQKPGIVVIGVGFGVLIASLLENNNYYYNGDGINVGIVAVCTGVSMIIASRLDKRKSSKEE